MRRMLMVLAVLFVCAVPAFGTELVILHTNDLHSHLLGFGPNADYTPLTTGDDATVGGLARIATVIKREKAEHPGQVLVLDGGDFAMGSIFHTACREQACELTLLKQAGYDCVTLGNHEFDFRPRGLASMLRSAEARDGLPAVVAANVRFDDESAADDELAEVFADGLVRPWRVFERAGVRIGVFGLMGKQAAGVAPFAAPVTFADQVETAREMVRRLKDEQGVDVVICLSHSGVSEKGGVRGEDVRLARKVPGIDVIVSGHTHTELAEPYVIGETLVVQAGCFGEKVGRLVLEVTGGRVKPVSYRLLAVDDTIPGEPGMVRAVEEAATGAVRSLVDGFGPGDVLAETAFDLTAGQRPSNLADLVTDAIREALDEPGAPCRVSFECCGVIRDDLLNGCTGRLTVADVFRAMPLGIGMLDDDPGYGLVSFHLTGAEIRRALEVLTTIHPVMGSDYYLYVSGLRFAWNPHRMPFDRVVTVEMEQEDGGFAPLDTTRRNHELYKVGGNIYIASFLKVIGEYTRGLVSIVPKDGAGVPLEDLRTALVDARPDVPGVQELKEWRVLMDYVQGFDDLDGDGVPDVPRCYAWPELRENSEPSWSPATLVGHPHGLTLVVPGVLGLVLFVVIVLWRRRRAGHGGSEA